MPIICEKLGRLELFVAASTRCFPDIALAKSLQKLADLEFNSAEIVIGNAENDLQPEWLAQDFQAVCRLCVSCRQVSPVAFYFNIPTDDPTFFVKYENVLRLCKVLGVVTLIVNASPVGFPFNEEFERIVRLVKTSSGYGVTVSVLTNRETVAGTIDSLNSFAKGIPGMRIALDPSQFIFGYKTPIDYESLLPKVSHIRLRDTSAKQYQVKLGQGALEYKRFVEQLEKVRYNRVLCVDVEPSPNLNTESELRKMRLLLESLL